MAQVNESFTAIRDGLFLRIETHESFDYVVSGTFVGTVVIEFSLNGGTFWEIAKTITSPESANIVAQTSAAGFAWYRFRCTEFTSGMIVTSLTDFADVVPGRLFRDNKDKIVLVLRDDGVLFPEGLEVLGAVLGSVGDMNKTDYDPNLVVGDAFDMDNMVESATSKILTATERTNISNNVTHAAGDGSDHSDVALNTTHRGSSGSDHAGVALLDGSRTFTGSVNVATGQDYQVNGASVLSSTTLGPSVVSSSLTSVGTLTELDIDNININGNVISSTVGNITLTPFDTNVLLNGNLTVTTQLDVSTMRITANNLTNLLSNADLTIADSSTVNAQLWGKCLAQLAIQPI